MIRVKERPKSKSTYDNHLKWLVVVNRKVVGEHALKATADKHAKKIREMNK